MSRSSKIIVASCVCAAFLAVGIGCTVEDRDLEEKGLFMCKTDNDCLEGSKCVKIKDDADIVGRCTRIDDIDNCVDNDHDGFFYSEPEHDLECGYTETHPKDADDSDPMVYFGATEICDGKDNSGDGCVDSVCPADTDCKKEQSKCKPIIKPCWGSGTVESYDNSVCSADLIGAEKCIDGELKFVKRENGQYKVVEGGSCPKSTDDIKDYSEKDTCGNKRDDNCNTLVDEGCVSCTAELKELNETYPACYVTNGGVGKVSDADKSDPNSNYSNILEKCGGNAANCKCIGKWSCVSDNESPKCADGNGAELTEATIGSAPCYKTFD